MKISVLGSFELKKSEYYKLSACMSIYSTREKTTWSISIKISTTRAQKSVKTNWKSIHLVIKEIQKVSFVFLKKTAITNFINFES